MDYKQFRQLLSERLGRPQTDIDALTKGLGEVVSQALSEMDSVAVPTFGTFSPEVQPDTLTTDLSTGRRMMLPPEVEIRFTPGSMLLKHLRHE